MRAKLVPEFVCSNFAESHRFYTVLLGFRVLYSRPEERFAYLERDGAELMLEQSVGKDRLWPRAELAYPFGRGINFQIQVADAERLHKAILAAGVAAAGGAAGAAVQQVAAMRLAKVRLAIR